MGSLDEQIAALEAQLAPEPTQAEQDEREKRERVATLTRKLRAQRIEHVILAAKEAAKGMYHVEAVDLDERAELDPSITTWFVVRGCTRKEQKAFEDATSEAKIDADGGRAKLLSLVKACVIHPRLGDPAAVTGFEDAINHRFGLGLSTLVDKILRLGGYRAASERSFR